MSEYSLYTDGGARGNPGHAAVGGVCFKQDTEVFRFKKYIGETTNNVAEYVALIYGLKACKNEQINEIECFLDSQLVVRQLNGVYKVKNENIKKYFDEVVKQKKNFGFVKFNHVPRAQNKIADSLVNQALDSEL